MASCRAFDAVAPLARNRQVGGVKMPLAQTRIFAACFDLYVCCFEAEPKQLNNDFSLGIAHDDHLQHRGIDARRDTSQATAFAGSSC